MYSALISALRYIGAQRDTGLKRCGDTWYARAESICYDDKQLCPLVDSQPVDRYHEDCYPRIEAKWCLGKDHDDPPIYEDDDSTISEFPLVTTLPTVTALPAPEPSCSNDPTRFELSEPPYTNYFYSDCNSASQVVVTSPLKSSNLTIIGPRLLVAWPAGNSGVVTFFEPQDGKNGTLSISLVNSSTTDNALDPIWKDEGYYWPTVGISGLLKLDKSAKLSVAILGSVRTIRDFTEGPSLLQPVIQDALNFSKVDDGAASISRLWLDNMTTTTLTFAPTSRDDKVQVKKDTLLFDAGTYRFNASFNYPQLIQLDAQEALAPSSKSLKTKAPSQTDALSFLSYSDKLLAGAWRFLTYFGRDSMISMLLMEPILSSGKNSSLEAGISALLERINKTDGSACHEETIGDYATFLNRQNDLVSTKPLYDYKMIDTDYFVPIILARYFIDNEVGRKRAKHFLKQTATVDPDNFGLTYAELALRNAEKIMYETALFAAEGGQKKEHLIHLKDGELVGEWRDSTYGIGGGRIPYDVNTAIVPAGLRAIAALAEAGFFPKYRSWVHKAAKYAQVWEDHTLKFFEIKVSKDDAQDLVNDYVKSNDFPFPSRSKTIESDVTFHSLALDGNNKQTQVRVMNTDDCFRHFLLNTTNQDDLTAFISQTADNILAPYPVGLSTDVGLLVANPAYGDNDVYSANFSNSAYHGTVVWSWQLAMMAAGLERQLGRCDGDSAPDFCSDKDIHSKVIKAYNHLWDIIEANSSQLSSEVWSWKYEDGKFKAVPLGELPPPPGQSPTESNIRQLWSLTFLAVKRNKSFK
ncbi:carbohydrate binding domain-containing protein [Sarocladium implicatum]|nr:carbohydrate binding domain-containing protein [Sarocladium implicatum]